MDEAYLSGVDAREGRRSRPGTSAGKLLSADDSRGASRYFCSADGTSDGEDAAEGYFRTEKELHPTWICRAVESSGSGDQGIYQGVHGQGSSNAFSDVE